MDLDSSLVIVGGIVSLIVIVVVLVLILYKPGKKLIVECSMKEVPGINKNYVKIRVKNTGKKRIKIMAPFVSFYNLQHSEIFQIDPKKVHCKFPRILKVGEEVSCEAEIGHYKEILQKKDFEPHKVKFFIKDTVGMQFNSNSFDYHLD